MIYIGIGVFLFTFLTIYIRLAGRIGIVDAPNERSSHNRTTVRGGGIIFPIAILSWIPFYYDGEWPLILGILLISIVGFLDDRYSLSQISRLLVQSASVFLLLFELGLFQEGILLTLIAFVLVTGWLNTFNFMDGINGITVLYALSVFIGAYLFNERFEMVQIPFSLLAVSVLSLIIFAFYNVRTSAQTFAGDVGSLSMGLILAYLVSSLMVAFGRWEFIVMVSVYGVDSVMTIVHRLLKKENIFEAHRTHLYQYLANEMGWNHIVVSGLYSLLQMGITLGLYMVHPELWTRYCLFVLMGLMGAYVISKRLILSRLG